MKRMTGRTANLGAARSAKMKVKAMLSDVPNVSGIGIMRIGDGFGVKVNLMVPLSKRGQVPAEVDGVPVVTEVVGKISKRR